jgi:hypothetical protein
MPRGLSVSGSGWARSKEEAIAAAEALRQERAKVNASRETVYLPHNDRPVVGSDDA